jgi:hypothetical protein
MTSSSDATGFEHDGVTLDVAEGNKRIVGPRCRHEHIDGPRVGVPLRTGESKLRSSDRSVIGRPRRHGVEFGQRRGQPVEVVRLCLHEKVDVLGPIVDQPMERPRCATDDDVPHRVAFEDLTDPREVERKISRNHAVTDPARRSVRHCTYCSGVIGKPALSRKPQSSSVRPGNV